MFKAVISGEMMSVEKKHQDVREIEPFAKHIILTNHMPRIRDYSDGLFRRVSIIPLDRQFMGFDADPHLIEKLRGELDAITSRAMDALGQLIIRNGKFTRPSSSVAALEEWRLENNHLSEFVAERLCIDPRASLGVQVVYDAYVGWFTSTGLRGMLGRKQFSKRLAALLRMPNKRTAEGYTFQGVALR
jgi:putative DNA primase/helicase